MVYRTHYALYNITFKAVYDAGKDVDDMLNFITDKQVPLYTALSATLLNTYQVSQRAKGSILIAFVCIRRRWLIDFHTGWKTSVDTACLVCFFRHLHF
jgi:hypothetical protein